MKLAFHYHTPAIIRNGKVVLPAYLGLFLDSIAPHFDELLCIMHTPSSAQMEMMDYEIKSENVQLFSLAPHSSIPNRYLNSGPSIKVIKKVLSLADAVLIRASTPLLPFFKKHWKKPIALMLVSDATLGLENLPQPDGERG